MKRLRLGMVFIVGAGLCFASAFIERKAVRGAASSSAYGQSSSEEEEIMKPYTETVPGSGAKFEMVPIPGGTFTMGSPAGEAGRSEDEGPQHRVAIHPFWMEKYETTWNEYDVFAFSRDLTSDKQPTPADDKLADAVTRPTPPYSDPTFDFGREGHPAISMTHHAAMEYTRWLSAKTGREYRLPTEAEWEYACRAGSDSAFYYGGDPKQLGDYAWFLDNSDARPHEGGKKKPNAWGLYDMLGNLGEWVLDEYDKDFYQSFKPGELLVEPVMLPTKKKYPNVVRGGSWDDDAKRVRCAARQASNPDWNFQDPQRPQSIWWLTDGTFVGFRVVRPVAEEEKLKGVKSLVKKYDF